MIERGGRCKSICKERINQKREGGEKEEFNGERERKRGRLKEPKILKALKIVFLKDGDFYLVQHLIGGFSARSRLRLTEVG